MSMPPLSPVWEGLAILLLVVVSGAYTAAETALLSLMRAHRHQQEEEEDLRPRPFGRDLSPWLVSRLDHPGLLTATFMLGRMVARVLAATVTALLAFRWALRIESVDPRWTLVGGVAVTVLLLLLLAEVLPRVVASRSPETTLTVTVPLVRISAVLFTPITLVLTWLLRRLGRSESHDSFLTADELRQMLEERQDAGQLEEEDREMIEDLLEFGETMVREVMVPRIDIVGIPDDADREAVHGIVRETGHSRLPVYHGDIDHVVGIVHAKDLLRLDVSVGEIRKAARKSMFVPETKMIDDLLREFQRTRTHMAIVVDEYGGTAGLVTLEDLLEEIVGEIQDEYDSETPLIQSAGPDSWLVTASVDLEDFEEETDVQLPKDGYDTLGGFLYSLEGRVPEAGQTLRWENITFLIRETHGRRILTVEVTRGPVITPEDAD